MRTDFLKFCNLWGLVNWQLIKLLLLPADCEVVGLSFISCVQYTVVLVAPFQSLMGVPSVVERIGVASETCSRADDEG